MVAAAGCAATDVLGVGLGVGVGVGVGVGEGVGVGVGVGDAVTAEVVATGTALLTGTWVLAVVTRGRGLEVGCGR